MPGLYGLTLKNSEKTYSEIANMKLAMNLYDHFKFLEHHFYYDNKSAIGLCSIQKIAKISQCYNKEKFVEVFVDGEIYNLDELNQIFKFDNKKNFEFSELLISSYLIGKLDYFLSKVDGYFNAVLYDLSEHKISLITDRYGMGMMYWSLSDNCFCWSSEVKGLLSIENISKKINLDSIDCFLDLGYLLGENTWFQNIKLQKPATRLVYDVKKHKLNTYLYWSWSEYNHNKISFNDAVDGAHDYFKKSIKKRFYVNDKIGVSLSGGLDSRAIIAELYENNPNFNGYAYTFGVKNCEDIDIANRVISKTNWEHDTFYFEKEDWFNKRINFIWNTDGMMDLQHMHGAEFGFKISQKMSTNINGYLGDVVMGGGWLNPVFFNQKPTSMSTSDFYFKYAHLDSFEDDYFNINRREVGLFSSRARRFTNMGNVNMLPWVKQRIPFFDNDLLKHLITMPEEYRYNNLMYSSMLKIYYPKFFKTIPWQKTGFVVGQKNLSIYQKLYRKMKRTVKGNKYFYHDYPNWIRSEKIKNILYHLFDKKKSILYSKINEHSFFETLENHMNDSQTNNTNLILRIATIELYLRMVFKQSIKLS